MKTLTPKDKCILMKANSCYFESAEKPKLIGKGKTLTKLITKAKTYIFTYNERFLLHLGKSGQRVELLQIISRQKNTVSPKCSFDSLFVLFWKCHWLHCTIRLSQSFQRHFSWSVKIVQALSRLSVMDPKPLPPSLPNVMMTLSLQCEIWKAPLITIKYLSK